MDEGLDNLNTLQKQYDFVATKSNSLHSACQHLLEEQTKLSSTNDKIGQKLVFFTEADRINQKLTSTTMSVNSDMFFQLLDKTDQCFLYVLSHVRKKLVKLILYTVYNNIYLLAKV